MADVELQLCERALHLIFNILKLILILLQLLVLPVGTPKTGFNHNL